MWLRQKMEGLTLAPGAEAGAQTTGESTQAESLQEEGEPVRGVVGIVSLNPASWRRAPPFAVGHPFLAWMNHSCPEVHHSVGLRCGPLAPLCIDIFLKRTGPKKEGLKNNGVFTLPHAPRGHIHQPLRSGSGSLGASIRPASGPSLLSLLFVSSSRPRFLCCSPWLPAPVDIHPPTFSHGPPLLTDFRSPPFHLPDSSLPSCPSFLCHAVRAALLPHPVTAVPSEIPPGLTGGSGWEVGVQMSGVSSITQPSSLLPVINSVLKTLRLVLWPFLLPHQLPWESSILQGVLPHHLAWSFLLLTNQVFAISTLLSHLGPGHFLLGPSVLCSLHYLHGWFHGHPLSHPLGADEYVCGPDLPHYPTLVCRTF